MAKGIIEIPTIVLLLSEPSTVKLDDIRSAVELIYGKVAANTIEVYENTNTNMVYYHWQYEDNQCHLGTCLERYFEILEVNSPEQQTAWDNHKAWMYIDVISFSDNDLGSLVLKLANELIDNRCVLISLQSPQQTKLTMLPTQEARSALARGIYP